MYISLYIFFIISLPFTFKLVAPLFPSNQRNIAWLSQLNRDYKFHRQKTFLKMTAAWKRIIFVPFLLTFSAEIGKDSLKLLGKSVQ